TSKGRCQARSNRGDRSGKCWQGTLDLGNEHRNERLQLVHNVEQTNDLLADRQGRFEDIAQVPSEGPRVRGVRQSSERPSKLVGVVSHLAEVAVYLLQPVDDTDEVVRLLLSLCEVLVQILGQVFSEGRDSIGVVD